MEDIKVDTPRTPVTPEFVSPGPKITDPQRKFLKDLLNQKDLTGVDPIKLESLWKSIRISEDPEEYGLSKAKASELITWLLRRDDKPREQVQREPEVASDIPDGYYALRDMPGHKNEITFYRLNTGKHGRWKGFQFIDMVVGGGSRYPQRGADVRKQIYNSINEQGVNEARQLYGQEIGRCGVCNRELTDDTSRALGIGPVCREGF